MDKDLREKLIALVRSNGELAIRKELNQAAKYLRKRYRDPRCRMNRHDWRQVPGTCEQSSWLMECTRPGCPDTHYS